MTIKTAGRAVYEVLRRLMLLGLAIGLLGVLLPQLAAAQPQEYRITDLGTLYGTASGAQGIDDDNWVIGWSDAPDGLRHAFLYGDGTLMDLGPLPGGSNSFATTISPGGRIAGYAGINEYGENFVEVRQAFIWANGLMHPIGALHSPGDFNTRYGSSEAHGVNDKGQVVGHSETARGSWIQHAFLWQDDEMQDIGGGAGDWAISRAYAINNAAQVVGEIAESAGILGPNALFDREAYLWQDGERTLLGTLPGHGTSVARAINEKGQVAGWSGSADGLESSAFFWSEGEMRNLGTLPGDDASQALSLNDSGQVVGWSSRPEQSIFRAFLWQDGEMQDLNGLLPEDSGWLLLEASDINNQGVIVGTGVLEGQIRGFMLEPGST